MKIKLYDYEGKEQQYELPCKIEEIKELELEDLSGDEVLNICTMDNKDYTFDTGAATRRFSEPGPYYVYLEDPKEIADWIYDRTIMKDIINLEIKPITLLIGPDNVGKTKLAKELETLDNENGEMIIFEENPENGHWPKAQADLAIRFSNQVFASLEEGRKHRNYIIETNSDYLVRKFMVLIADTNSKLTHDMVRLYYMDRDEDSRVPYVVPYNFNENGKPDEKLPKDFSSMGYQLCVELVKTQEHQE